jgi:hypothetical protein
MSRQFYESLGGDYSDIVKGDTLLRAVGGAHIPCIGSVQALVTAQGGREITTEFFIVESIGPETEVLVGDPTLRDLTSGKVLRVKYAQDGASATIGTISTTSVVDVISDTDCIITKHPHDSGFKWQYEWRWKGQPPPSNRGQVPAVYWKKINRQTAQSVIDEWASRTLEPCHEPKFCIPINLVEQEKEGHKIRVTGDCKAFNKFIISASTEESNEVCTRAIRLIRGYEDGTFLDLSKAYQSISLAPHLRDYNAFRVRDQWYRSQKMLFGIAIGQKVLYLVLKRILGEKSISFRDDIFIPKREHEEEIKKILITNGFTIKENSVWSMRTLDHIPKKILGLEVFREGEHLHWKAPKVEFPHIVSARDLAGVLGQAVPSHLPCGGKGRAQAAILRSLLGRLIGGDQSKWNNPIPGHLHELWEGTQIELTKTRSYRWHIPPGLQQYTLYTDASKFLTGGIIRGVGTDDLVDFCKVHYDLHINIRELDAIIWGMQALEEIAPKGSDITIVTDSKSCFAWLELAIADGIIRTKALYKSLIKARIDIIKETLRINGWRTTAKWVKSKDNPADELTRVPPRFREVWKEYHRDREEADMDADEEEIMPEGDLMGMVETESLEQSIAAHHKQRLHPGESAMVKIMSEVMPDSPPGLITAIRKVIAECILCRRKRPPNPYVNLKGPEPLPARPWEWAQVDTVSISHQPPLKLIMLIDEYSRFIEYVAVSGAPKAEDTIRLLESWHARYNPSEWNLRMDRGREFYNTKVSQWIRGNRGTPHYSTVRRPTACGMIERANRTVLSIMRIAKHEFPESPISEVIRKSIHEYWNRPHRALAGRRPNAVVRGSVVLEDDPQEDNEEEYPSDDESSASDSETRVHPERPVQEFYTPQSRASEGNRQPEPAAPVLAYVPQAEKLDFNWIPAEVVSAQDGVFRVKPEGHRETVLNQRWIQELPVTTSVTQEVEQRSEQLNDQQIETSEVPDRNTLQEPPNVVETSPGLRRSARNRRAPQRFSDM